MSQGEGPLAGCGILGGSCSCPLTGTPALSQLKDDFRIEERSRDERDHAHPIRKPHVPHGDEPMSPLRSPGSCSAAFAVQNSSSSPAMAEARGTGALSAGTGRPVLARSACATPRSKRSSSASSRNALGKHLGGGFTPTTTRIVAEFVDEAPPSWLGSYNATRRSVGVPLGTCQGIVQFRTVRRAPNRNVDLDLRGARQAATGSLVGQNFCYSTACISGLALTSRSLHLGGKSGYLVTLSERSCPDAEPQRIPGRRGYR
jgi:hypothetical protein